MKQTGSHVCYYYSSFIVLCKIVYDQTSKNRVVTCIFAFEDTRKQVVRNKNMF